MSRNTGGALSPEKYYQLGTTYYYTFHFSSLFLSLGKSSPASSSKGSSYIRNTVLIANQLLDSIEKDVKLSKNAVESKDRYISQLENENATLCAQLIESKVVLSCYLFISLFSILSSHKLKNYKQNFMKRNKNY